MEASQRPPIKLVADEPAPPRLPPHNLEAEQALLAAILHNNHAYEKVSDFLLAAHFADASHGRIFEACGKLIERGQLANAVTLKGFFEQDGDLSDVGGAAYLAELQSAPVSPDVRHYGTLIHDLYLRRELIALAQDIDESAYAQELDTSATDHIETAEQRLYRLAETGLADGGLQPFSLALTDAVSSIESAYRRDGALAGIATHFTELDKLLGGLHKSDLIILAGDRKSVV